MPAKSQHCDTLSASRRSAELPLQLQLSSAERIRLASRQPLGSQTTLSSHPESGASAGLKRSPISLVGKGSVGSALPTILLADDNEDDVRLISAVIKRVEMPYQLELVRNGDLALAYLKGEGAYADRSRYPLPVLMLLDLKMPGATGFEVLQWVRSQRHLDRLLVVVLTGSTRASDMEKAFQFGANAYVAKSAKYDDLVSLLNSFDLLS